jgi:hypothetical protein
MYYIAFVTDLSIPVSSDLNNLTFEEAMIWMENVGNIVEYTIVTHT